MTDLGSGPRAAGGLAEMNPAYFAVVMSTGIVSIATELLGAHSLAVALFALNVPVYVTTWALTVTRIARHRERVLADLRDHGRSVGFFTAVPATSVLGSQFLVIGGNVPVAGALWGFAVLLWAGLIYGILTILTVKADKPPLAEGINGGWQLIVVAAQSVCVLGAQLGPQLPAYQPHVLLFCLAMWLGGGMLYFWIISLIFYRYTFFCSSSFSVTSSRSRPRTAAPLSVPSRRCPAMARLDESGAAARRGRPRETFGAPGRPKSDRLLR